MSASVGGSHHFLTALNMTVFNREQRKVVLHEQRVKVYRSLSCPIKKYEYETMNDKVWRTERAKLNIDNTDEGSSSGDDNEITSDLLQAPPPLIRGLYMTKWENETVKNNKRNMLWRKEYATLKAVEQESTSDIVDDDPTLIQSHRPGPDQGSLNESIEKPNVPIRGVCQCCYEDISTSTSISCSMNKHLFCFDCVRRYVEEFVYGDSCPHLVQYQAEVEGGLWSGVGGGLTRLACLAGECGEIDNGYVSHEAVEQVASERLWENYQERIFRLEFHQQKNADQLVEETCGQAEDTTSTNSRQTTGVAFPAAPRHARKKSIDTISKEASHSSFRLVRDNRASFTAGDTPGSTILSRWTTSREEQSILKSESDLLSDLDRKYRHVEEALTESKLRKCPACNTPFLKESGCNKFRCPGCRVYMCYICSGIVPKNGYTHFCQHKYDTCNLCSKCPLWTLQDELKDQERLRQLATNEVNRIWEEVLLSDDRDKIGSLDIERFLHDLSTAHPASSYFPTQAE